MNTFDYINKLRKNSKEPECVAMRQALCYFLSISDVPRSIIGSVMHMTRSNMYFSINHAKDMLETGDKIMRKAYAEISVHKVRVLPVTMNDDVLSRHVGYKLTIDNEIY